MKKRILALALSLCLVVGLLPAAALAADTSDFSDMPTDYSAAAMEAAVKNGLYTGYDGKLRPDESLSRAEMAAIITYAFGAVNKADISAYKDLAPGEWYCDHIARAVAMKALTGDDRAMMMPNTPVTREQAFASIAHALQLEDGSAADLAAFRDAASVSKWAVGPVAAMVNNGYVAGSDGCIDPQSNITRKDFAVVLNGIIGTYITDPADIPALEGNVMIKVPDVTLSNKTIQGSLIIGDGVGSGDIALDNVKVTGRLIVRGGGANSVVIKGASSIGSVVVAKVDGNVRLAVEGAAKVETVTIADGKSDVKVEGAVATLEVTGEVPVVLDNATVENVVVSAPKAEVTVSETTTVTILTAAAAETTVKVEGTVETVAATEAAAGAKLEVAETARVTTLETKAADTAMNVAGAVTNVTVAETAAGAKVEVGEKARVETVTTAAADSKLDVSGTVANVTVTETAGKAEVNTNAGASIGTVDSKAEGVTVGGEGRVENAVVSGNNTAINTSGTKTEVAEGATGTTAGGTTVAGGTTSTTEGALPPAATTPTTPSTPSTPTYTPSVHSHTYAAEWSKDETYHWHAATCEHTEQVSDKAAHTEEIIPGYAATCISEGKTDGKKCSVCGEILVAQTEIDRSTVPHTPSGRWYAYNGVHYQYCAVEGCMHSDGPYDHTYNTDGVCSLCGAVANAVAKIGDVYYSTLTDAFAAAVDYDTVTLLAGTHDLITLGQKNITGLTITAEAGAIVKGILVDVEKGATALTITNLTLSNIKFQEKGFHFNCTNQAPFVVVNGLTMSGCSFTASNRENDVGNRLFDVGTDSVGSNQFRNIVINNCTATGGFQGIRLGALYGGEVSGCTITGVAHNAITLRGVHGGTITVSGNTISDGNDRAFRASTIDADVTVNFTNNTITNTGDNGSNWKVNTNNGTVTFDGNTVNGAAWDGSDPVTP